MKMAYRPGRENHVCLAHMSSVVVAGFHETVCPGGSTIGGFDELLCHIDGFGKVARSSVGGFVAEFR
jgi:hypothetical protein